MQHTIDIQSRQFLIDGKPLDLISGSVHYWRLAPQRWETILDSVKDLGLSVISTYIPWEYHETSLHTYDFTGETEPGRNLLGFLELVRSKELFLIARPGPYIYSEWKNFGLPDRVSHLHRLHPEFLAESRHYLSALAPILQPFFATRGGPIILLQYDNELDPFTNLFEEQLGFFTPEGLYKDFLQGKYTDVHSLNESWQTNYTDFSQAGIVSDLPFKTCALTRRYLDFREFLNWYVEESCKWFFDTFHELGLDLPLMANTYESYHIQHWDSLNPYLSICGVDSYPNAEFATPADAHQSFMQFMRLTRLAGKIPFIAEFQCGIWHGQHIYSGIYPPQHYRLSAFSALAAGVCGWNWYMLVNRDNWYMAPINENGTPRPELTSVFSEIIDIFHHIKPAELEKKTQLGVYITPEALYHDPYNAELKPVLTTLYDSDIDYKFTRYPDPEQTPFLIYSGPSKLAPLQQTVLRKYVETGGTLFTFQIPPSFLDVPFPESIIGGGDYIGRQKCLLVQLGDREIPAEGPVHYYSNVPGNAIRARHTVPKDTDIHQFELMENVEYIIGYDLTYGKGRVIVSGFIPSVKNITALLASFNVPLAVQSKTPTITTACFYAASREKYYLFVLNNGNEDKHASILLRNLPVTKKSRCIDLRTKTPVDIHTNNIYSLTVFVARKDATVLDISL